ncbi:MAG: tetratricopeptide repeat protein [Myxococcales bacterium]|nr:tetratricopeptide repeat protein [Myxococcales bacterium]
MIRLPTSVVDLESRSVRHLDGTVLALTAREGSLLAFLAAHPFKTWDRQDLLREVWGYRGGAETRVVDVTVWRLRNKLGDPEAQVLKTVAGAGYRWEHGDKPGPKGPAVRAVGRDAELAGLRAALSTPAVVVLFGTAGIGKSRLARVLASERVHVWVDLAVARTEADVLASIAEGLAMAPEAARAPHIRAVLASAPARLLVLDDAEGAFLASSAALNRLAGACPILVTSRFKGRLEGQVLIEVGPLSVAAGVQLVCAEAPRTTPADAELLVRALDCVPLALRLAAARLDVLPVPALLRRLGDRLELLRSTRSDLGPRQASVRGALECSWEFLTEPQRNVATDLSTFAGIFSLEDAEAVADDPGVLDVIEELCDRSILRVEGPGLLEIHPFVRAWLVEHRRERGLDAELRHARYIATRSTYAADHAIDGPSVAELHRVCREIQVVVERLTTTSPELAAAVLVPLEDALLQCSPRPDLTAMTTLAADPRVPSELRARLGAMAARVLLTAGSVGPARQALTAALALGSTSQRLVRYHDARADVLSGHPQLAVAAHRALVAEADAAGDVEQACANLVGMVVALRMMGRVDESLPVLEDVLRRGPHLRRRCTALVGLGACLSDLGKFEAAAARLTQAVEMAAALGSPTEEGSACLNLGIAQEAMGAPDEAERALRRGLDCARRAGNDILAVGVLSVLARILAPRRLAEAEQILSDLSGHPTSGMPPVIAVLLEHARAVAAESRGEPELARIAWARVAEMYTQVGDERRAGMARGRMEV